MVSFQTPFSELNQTKTISLSENNSKKRKWDDTEPEEILPCKQWKNPKATANTTKSFSDIELHLETPLPSEWQRCLDIQSGEIHFYNTRTHKRTLRDPRTSPEPSSPRDCHNMSLDLELNLPCGSLNNNSSSTSEKCNTSMKKRSSNSPPSASSDHLFMSLSTDRKNNYSSNNEAADQPVEMVATACMRCHMLVMLCKASPTCPNCKFMHPPYQTPPYLLKAGLGLSC